jgi:CcmD family protein
MNKPMRVVVFLLLLLSTPVIAQQPSPQSAPPKQQEEFVPVSQLPPQDQLPAAPLLVTAYAFVWIALFGYVVSVARRLTKVQREVERLEADMKRGTRA